MLFIYTIPLRLLYLRTIHRIRLRWSFLRPRKYFYKIRLLELDRARRNYKTVLIPAVLSHDVLKRWRSHLQSTFRIPFDMEFSSPLTIRNIKISNADIYCLIYHGRVSHLASLQMLKFNIQDHRHSDICCRICTSWICRRYREWVHCEWHCP